MTVGERRHEGRGSHLNEFHLQTLLAKEALIDGHFSREKGQRRGGITERNFLGSGEPDLSVGHCLQADPAGINH